MVYDQDFEFRFRNRTGIQQQRYKLPIYTVSQKKGPNFETV